MEKDNSKRNKRITDILFFVVAGLPYYFNSCDSLNPDLCEKHFVAVTLLVLPATLILLIPYLILRYLSNDKTVPRVFNNLGLILMVFLFTYYALVWIIPGFFTSNLEFFAKLTGNSTAEELHIKPIAEDLF